MSSYLSIPAPLKRLFDATPLVVYEDNDLPQRSVRLPDRSARQDIHAFFSAHTQENRKRTQKEGALHTFFSWAGEVDGSNPKIASFNPGCLRWQTYLVFRAIEFYIVPANNHASFPGTLPTISTHPDAGPPFTQPIISADGLLKWVRKNEALPNREEAYLTLVDGPIRRAWVSLGIL